MGKISPWQDEKSWKIYGMEQGYEERNPTSLSKSKNKDERSWYSRGIGKRWLGDFSFRRKIIRSPLNSFEDWEAYGMEQGYDRRNPKSLSKSKDRKERSWYSRGCDKKWVSDFSFSRNKIVSSPFNSLEDWKAYGVEQGYGERNPRSLSYSENKSERSWYWKGVTEKWLGDFSFSRKRDFGRFKTFEKWEAWGLERGYDQRNPKSFPESDDRNERSWYKRGSRKKWLLDFSFSRKKRNLITSREKFNVFLEENPVAGKLVALAGMLGKDRLVLEGILMDVYDGRFKDHAELSRLVDISVKGVYKSLKGQTPKLTKYMGRFYGEPGDVEGIPPEVVEELENLHMTSLDDRLFHLFSAGYGPIFNQQPKTTLRYLERKRDGRKGKSSRLYSRLHSHYQRTMELKEMVEAA